MRRRWSPTWPSWRDFPAGSDGEFGWSLPRGEAPLSLRSLGQLAGHVGIHWLKFPVWYDEQSASRGEDLARFAERLSSQHVRLIGVLDAPPKSIKDYFDDTETLPIASVFVDPAVWRPALDPILTRLSLAVRWWQLGADRDTSFAGLPELETKLGQVRDELNRFGHDLDLGLSWRSVDEMPPAKACSFLALTARPEPTAEELLDMLSGDFARRYPALGDTWSRCPAATMACGHKYVTSCCACWLPSRPAREASFWPIRSPPTVV